MFVKNLIHAISILFCMLFTISNALGQESDSLKTPPITLGTTYIGDAVYNFSGGLKTGEAYMGYIDITASVSTQGLGLWNNGELFVNVQN